MENKASSQFRSYLWDLGCAISLVGIWPRFIEPYFLESTSHTLSLPHLPEGLRGLRIVQLSDLHFSASLHDTYLEKIRSAISGFNPDLILFTGDFLCNSRLEDRDRMRDFLRALHARYGCYAILGNHDYESVVTLTPYGEYTVIASKGATAFEGLRRLLTTPQSPHTFNDEVPHIGMHKELTRLLEQTPFQLLHNKTARLTINGAALNIVGLGDYMLKRTLPEEAYKSYDKSAPGIILTHNPDSIKCLQEYPGEVILCGHTHGAQINIPWVRHKLMLLENRKYVRGLHHDGGRWIYISRGVGSTAPFRLASRPEVTLFVLDRCSP